MNNTIKISELEETTQVNDNDLLVVVDVANNETKKVQAQYVGTGQGGAEIPISDTEPLDPEENDLWIDTSEPEEIQEAIKNVYSDAINETYSCDYINDINTYSTDEVFTGKFWIDGKPIYRTVVVKTNFTTGETENNHNISDIDEITDVRGMAHRVSGDYEPIPATVVPSSYMSQYQSSVYDINTTRYKLYLGSSLGTGNTKVDKLTLIIEYTKTTD